MAVNNELKLDLVVYDGAKGKRCKLDNVNIEVTFPNITSTYSTSTDDDGNVKPFSAPYTDALQPTCKILFYRSNYKQVKVAASIGWAGALDNQTGLVSLKSVNMKKLFS